MINRLSTYDRETEYEIIRCRSASKGLCILTRLMYILFGFLKNIVGECFSNVLKGHKNQLKHKINQVAYKLNILKMLSTVLIQLSSVWAQGNATANDCDMLDFLCNCTCDFFPGNFYSYCIMRSKLHLEPFQLGHYKPHLNWATAAHVVLNQAH